MLDTKSPAFSCNLRDNAITHKILVPKQPTVSQPEQLRSAGLHFLSSSPLPWKKRKAAVFFFFSSTGALGSGRLAGEISLVEVNRIGGAGGLSSSAILTIFKGYTRTISPKSQNLFFQGKLVQIPTVKHTCSLRSSSYVHSLLEFGDVRKWEDVWHCNDIIYSTPLPHRPCRALGTSSILLPTPFGIITPLAKLPLACLNAKLTGNAFELIHLGTNYKTPPFRKQAPTHWLWRKHGGLAFTHPCQNSTLIIQHDLYLVAAAYTQEIL